MRGSLTRIDSLHTTKSDLAPYAPYKYFSIEFGRDCRCGTELQHRVVLRDNCNSVCKSNSTQQCGPYDAEPVDEPTYDRKADKTVEVKEEKKVVKSTWRRWFM
jgi:hypothetical protein